VALAIVSSHRNQRVPADVILIGEIGLSGELRSVSQLDQRLTEAAKLGFRRALVPTSSKRQTQGDAPAPGPHGMVIKPVRSLIEGVDLALSQEEYEGQY
jgi:DNA repair protein RadA/Sms